MTRPQHIIAALYGALWLVVVLFYPHLRGDALLWLYAGAELAGGVFAVGCFGWWVVQRDVKPENRLTLTTATALLLVSASLATTVLPALAGPAMIGGWPAIATIWCVALGVVTGVQCWELLR